MDFLLLAALFCAGATALLLFLFHPRLALAAAALAVLFTPTLVVATGLGWVSLIDDALVLGCFLYFTVRRLAGGYRLRKLPGGRWFVAVLAAGLIGSLLNDVPIAVAMSGGYLLMKGAMYGFAVAQVEWSDSDVIRVGQAIRGFLVILVVCAVANLAAPDAWARIFASSGLADHRGPIASIIGPFTVPSFMGQIVGLCVLATVAFAREIGGVTRSVAVLGFCASLLTFRRKTWVSVPLALAAMTGIRRKSTLLLIGGPALLAGLLLFQGPVTETVDQARYEYFEKNSSVPRILMYQGAVELANEHAPVGAGLGRWGSDAALTHYSPEYVERGFHQLDGLGPLSQNNYATDTFWPIVIGETGWVGAAFYVIGLWSIWRVFRTASRARVATARILGSLGIGWLTLLLIESVAAPVFTGPPVYPWVFAGAGLAAAVLDRITDAERSSVDLVSAG